MEIASELAAEVAHSDSQASATADLEAAEVADTAAEIAAAAEVAAEIAADNWPPQTQCRPAAAALQGAVWERLEDRRNRQQRLTGKVSARIQVVCAAPVDLFAELQRRS